MKEKISSMNLLYRKNRDGFCYSNIVNKINNKANLIFLFNTNRFFTKNRIFGVFIKTKLENINLVGMPQDFSDPEAFVFCLNTNKKYSKINGIKHAIGFDGKNLIRIGNNFNSNGFYIEGNRINAKELLKEPRFYDFLFDFEFTEIDSSYLSELEIFELKFE